MPETVEANDAHWCDKCFKTYQRRDLLLRHRRRCLRSNKPTTRQKACHACVLAKSKCCYSQPSCARCSKRGLSCQYVKHTTTATATNHTDPPVPSSTRLDTPPRTTDSVPTPSDDSPYGDQLDAVWSTQAFPWPLDMIEVPTLPEAELEDNTLGGLPPITTSYAALDFSIKSPAVSPESYVGLPMDTATSSYPPIPDLLSMPSLGMLDPIPSPPYGETMARGSQGLWLLRQYPRRLLQDEFYSPFVHRILFSEQVPDMAVLRHSSVALCCYGGVEVKEATQYIKRAIEARRQTLIDAYPTYYCMEQWDALHAMLLYELLDLSMPVDHQYDGWKPPRPRGFKSPFLSRMTQVFARCYLKSHDDSLSPPGDAGITWNRWAVIETARRTIFLANIINYFSGLDPDPDSGGQSVYYEPLNDELILNLPLPCSHALWTAPTEEEWRKLLPRENSVSSIALSDPFSSFTPPPGPDGIEHVPKNVAQPSLKSLLSKFTKDYLRVHLGVPGFGNSSELRSFIILCALEQFA